MAFPAHWNPFIRRIVGVPEKGSSLEVRIEPSGARGMTFRPTVRVAEPPRELRWLGRLLIPGLFDGEHRFVIEPLPGGGVRFHQNERFSGLLVPMLRSKLDRETTRGFNEMNAAAQTPRRGLETRERRRDVHRVAAMSEHRASIQWKRSGPDFLKGQYSREHTWTFDGGLTIPASPSPSVVPAPYSNPAYVDPEEAFVAAIASCHMLTYVFLAQRQGFQADSYDDEAVGMMTKNERGVPWVSSVTLSPRITYSGEKLPSPADEETLHHRAHEECFITNSVRTEVTVRPRSGGSAS